MKSHEILLGGSTVLSVVRPGSWKSDDLDIIRKEAVLPGFEAFLGANSYRKVADRDLDLDGPQMLYESEAGQEFVWKRWEKLGRHGSRLKVDVPIPPQRGTVSFVVRILLVYLSSCNEDDPARTLGGGS